MELTLVSEFTDKSVSSNVPYLSESDCDADEDRLVTLIIGDLNSSKILYYV